MEIKQLILEGYKYLQFSDIDKITITNKHPIELICGSNGCGKSCTNDTLIKTVCGWTRIGDLHVGDSVYAVDGTLSTVTGVYPQGARDVYSVVLSDDRTLSVSLDHLWGVYVKHCDTYSYTVLDTKTIMEFFASGDTVYLPLAMSARCADIDVDIDPYLLGALLSNAFSWCSSSMITVNDGCDDALTKLLEQYSSIRTWPCNIDLLIGYLLLNIPLKKIGITDIEILDKLHHLGLLLDDNYVKFIPQVYFNGSTKQRYALLQGMLDMENSISHTHSNTISNISISCFSDRLANDLRTLIWSLGGTCTITSCENHTEQCQSDTNTLDTHTTYTIHAHLYMPDADIAPDIYSYDKVAISSIQKLDTQKECTCIAIDHPSKLYVAENYIVTHNTTLMKQYAPLSPTSTMFNKHGYKRLDIIHRDSEFVLSYDAKNKFHSFKKDGIELNTSGTSQVQDELVATHLQYDKLIDKLLFNKIKMTQMTPAARMEYLISINPINIRFIKDKYVKIVAQQKKIKAQLEMLQKRISKYKSSMMHDIEYQTYVKDMEQIKTIDDDILKLIYHYQACTKHITPTNTVHHTVEEYNNIYKSIIHDRTHLTCSHSTYDGYSDIELHQMLSQYQSDIQHHTADMTRLSKEIDELEKIVKQSSVENLTTLETEYKKCITAIAQYPDFTDKIVIQSWPPDKTESDRIYTLLQQLSNICNSVTDIYRTPIWSTKKYLWHRERWRRLVSVKDDLWTQLQQRVTHIASCMLDKRAISADAPDKTCVSTTCSFKLRHDKFLLDKDKEIAQCKMEQLQLDKDYKHKLALILKETELLNYQSVFHKHNSGILTSLWSTIGDISTELYRLYPKQIDSIVESINKDPMSIYTAIQSVLKDSSDHKEYTSLSTRAKELSAAIAAHKTDMSIAFAKKKLDQDYRQYTELETQCIECQRYCTDIQTVIEYRSRLSRLKDTIAQHISDIDSDIATATDLAIHTAYTSTVKQLQELHSHLADILRDMSQTVQEQTRNREAEKVDQTYIEALTNQLKELSVIEQALNPYNGLPGIYTKHHLNQILKNVNHFISQVFTYPLTVSLVEDKDNKYRFQVLADKIPVGDISNCSDGQMEMIDLAFTLAISIALQLHTTHPLFLDEIGRCLDTTHTQRLLEMLHRLVKDRWIHQLFLINHQAIVVGGFDSSTVDIVSLSQDHTVAVEHDVVSINE